MCAFRQELITDLKRALDHFQKLCNPINDEESERLYTIMWNNYYNAKECIPTCVDDVRCLRCERLQKFKHLKRHLKSTKCMNNFLKRKQIDYFMLNPWLIDRSKSKCKAYEENDILSMNNNELDEIQKIKELCFII